MYITESNFKKMLRKVSPEEKLNFNGELFKLTIPFLTKYERANLLASKFILEHPEILTDEKYGVVEKPLITGLYLNIKDLNNVGPAFHCYRDCKRLNADLMLIPVPKEVQQAGRTQEALDWYDENAD